MKKIAYAAFASLAALSLTACGSADDASSDAEADTVEMPADEVMAGTEAPVADADATAEDESASADAVAAAEAQGENAADVAAKAQAALAEDGN